MNKTELIQRQLTTISDLHLREVGEGEESRIIEGYAILFNTPSAALWSYEDGEVREIIAPEAVTKELLDASDIKMTMFHDRQLILARSRNGEGTLSYEIDEKGVKFSFEAPHTVDGDKALELVKRGDISGCSFAFTTRYYDESCVSHSVETTDGYTIETFTVRTILGIHDFTLAADPAYPDTTVDTRELFEQMKQAEKPAVEDTPTQNNYREQVAQMRKAAAHKLYI